MGFTDLVRSRDLMVWLLVVATIYMTLLETPDLEYSIEPAWFIDKRAPEALKENANIFGTSKSGAAGTGAANAVTAPAAEIRHLTLITDLDGDGNNELLTITNDYQMKLFSAEVHGQVGHEVYHPTEVRSVPLTEKGSSFRQGSIPVAISTGYVQTYDPSETRSQIIVVVREDWTVSCFDSTFRHLWDKAVASHTHHIAKLSEYFVIDSVSIFIAPFSLASDSTGGVVIVGADMRLRSSELDRKQIRMELGLDYSDNSNVAETEHKEMDAMATLEHFSIYALDAENGHILWKHDGSEMKAEQYTKSLPLHAYTLDVNDLMTKIHHAPGINDWTVFRRSFFEELPHSWNEPVDTRIKVANFARRHVGAGAGQQIHKKQSALEQDGSKKRKSMSSLGNLAASKVQKKVNLLKGVDAEPLPEDALLPHSPAEHTTHPNVLVVHTAQGIEVVGLRSGRPITSLALPGRNGRSYADIDGDGIIDTIVILDNKDSIDRHSNEFSTSYTLPDSASVSELRHCSMVVISGLPPTSQLFNGSLCHEKMSIYDSLGDKKTASYSTDGISSSHSNTARRVSTHLAPLPSQIIYSAPLVLKKSIDSSSVYSSSLEESLEKDVIVAIGTGVVTSYSGSGHFNWQLHNGPLAAVGSGFLRVLAYDPDARRVADNGGHNNIHANIVVVGDSSMSILSRDGDVLSESDIPDSPIGRPTFGDFDNDGISDITIVTNNAVLGYHVHIQKTSHTVVILLLILSTVALIVFAANIQLSSMPLQMPGGGGGGTHTVTKTALHLARSTDESHLD